MARVVEEIINSKGKHGRKYKSTTQEIDKPEPEIARIIDTLVLWKALVARMI
jgi:hypothetical protein